jgi:hypothetical protein
MVQVSQIHVSGGFTDMTDGLMVQSLAFCLCIQAEAL